MPDITLRIESKTGRSFESGTFNVQETPRIGEKVDLAPLFDLKSKDVHHAEVSSVIRTIVGNGVVVPSVVVFDTSTISFAVMEKAATHWIEYHSWDNR